MSIKKGLQLPFGVQPVNAIPVDSWSGPYTSSVSIQDAIDEANLSIPIDVRFLSMEVRLVVNGVSSKFWYKEGIQDTDLVEFLPVGLIKIEDLNGELFTDLTTAKEYIRNFITTTITDESFDAGIYSFTLPKNSIITGNSFMYNTSASIKDPLGLIIVFSDYCFSSNSGNNILGSCTFGENCFSGSSGINKFKNILLNDISNVFGYLSTGRFEIYGNIGTDETANYVNFFSGSTATIWVKKEKRTSNAGSLEGDLATAQTNGVGLFFEDMTISQDGVWLYDIVNNSHLKIKSTNNKFEIYDITSNKVVSIEGDSISLINTSSGKTSSINNNLLTDNRNYDLPDQSGTIALTSDIPALGVEVISTSVIATASVVTYDYSLSNLWYHGTASNNFTANFTNLPTTDNRVLSATILINQGLNAYIPNVVQIEGITQSVKWPGGTQSGTSYNLDIVTFNLIRINATWSNVIGQIASFT